MFAPAAAAALRRGREEAAAARASPHQLPVFLWANGQRRSRREKTTTVPDAWVLATAAAATAAALATLGPAPAAGPAPDDLSPAREGRGT